MSSDDPILAEQQAYYSARAPEYDDWFFRRNRYDRGEEHSERWRAEIETVRAALRALPPAGAVLELACGTGLWTEILAESAEELDVVDGSPEVLEICRSRVRHPCFTATCADLFEWSPARRYDLVFFSFWLSHVPPSRFEPFWSSVRRALRPDGRAFFVDSLRHSEYEKSDVRPGPAEEWRERRELSDGRAFDVVKIFHPPAELQRRLETLGWTAAVRDTGRFFLYGEAR